MSDNARAPAFPEFPERTALDATSAWTACFDSYNQRTDDCYYYVTLYEDEETASRFMVLVSVTLADEDLGTPAFVERLRQEIAGLAAAGCSNTPYAESLAGWLEGRYQRRA